MEKHGIVIMSIVACFCLAAAPFKIPPGSIFKWVDNKGTVHVCDELDQVPEPYYSLYYKKIQEMQNKKQQSQTKPNKNIEQDNESVNEKHHKRIASSTPSSSHKQYKSSGIIEQYEKQQAEWKNLVKFWRTSLSTATEKYIHINTELQNLTKNATLASLPQNKAKIATLQSNLQKQKKELEHARHMLQVELPKRAKREGVPLNWLR